MITAQGTHYVSQWRDTITTRAPGEPHPLVGGLLLFALAALVTLIIVAFGGGQ